MSTQISPNAKSGSIRSATGETLEQIGKSTPHRNRRDAGARGSRRQSAALAARPFGKRER